MEITEDKKVLLDIQAQLGRIEAQNAAIEATSTAIKEDIAELKQKDVEADKKLEKAYARAMEYAKTRQDNIRDDLQHQIDNNKTLILTVSNNLSSLNTNIEKFTKEIKESTEEWKKGFEQSISEWKTDVNDRLSALEQKKEKMLAKWYDRIVDKIMWIIIIAVIVVLTKWLNAPPEIMNQLPH